MKKFVTTLMLSMTLLTGITASAATQYQPEGGTWNYGVGATGSYSDYLNHRYEHSSTVTKGNKKDKSQVGPGVWAKSQLWEYSGCHFYYNTY